MRAWLERVTPPGEPIELPAGSGRLVFGKSPRATLIIDGFGVANLHAELAFEGGFWRLRPLAPEAESQVNGVQLGWPRPLFRGDRLQLGPVQLRYMEEAPQEHPGLMAAVLAHPDDAAARQVWADWLLERGDPLGERLARAHRGESVDHEPWIGPLWDRFLAGELEIGWREGLIRTATLRAAAGRPPWDWGGALGVLLRLRVACALEELVLDLPRLLPEEGRCNPRDYDEAMAVIARSPVVPPTLRRCSLGHRESTTRALAPVFASELLSARVPALAGQRVVTDCTGTHLAVMSTAPGVRLTGLTGTHRPLNDVTRLRPDGRTLLHLESPHGVRFTPDGAPCFLSRAWGTWRLEAGRLKGQLKVNGRPGQAWLLVPGDELEIPGLARLRFEVD